MSSPTAQDAPGFWVFIWVVVGFMALLTLPAWWDGFVDLLQDARASLSWESRVQRRQDRAVRKRASAYIDIGMPVQDALRRARREMQAEAEDILKTS
jgi:hypothetical protein